MSRCDSMSYVVFKNGVELSGGEWEYVGDEPICVQKVVALMV